MSEPLNVAYEAVKYWLPLVTGFGLVIRAYSSTTKSINAWANALLNNHLHSIQEATQETVVLLRNMRDNDAEIAEKVEQVRCDLANVQAMGVNGKSAVAVVDVGKKVD
jgi:hypothetical protein